MNVYDHIKGNPETVKRYIAEGHSAELAQGMAAADVLNAELGTRGSETPFRLWLRDQHIKNWYDTAPSVTSALWDEWQIVKESYIAARDAKAAAARAKYEAERKAAEVARRAALDETAKHEAAEEKRRAGLVAKLQPYEFQPIELEPVDFKKLHDLKKYPDKSKRRILQRWSERFEALPESVQTAWMAFHEETHRVTIHDPDLADGDDADFADDNDADDESPSGDDGSTSLVAYLAPLPPHSRTIDNHNVDAVVEGLRDPEFRKFRRFSEGVRRLLDLIGNPIDDVIDPPHDPHRPQPAQDLDDIEAPEAVPYVVPGLVPRGGLTVVHGDSGACKSLFLQKLSLVVADKNGATFEGVEVEHGQVLFATLDPSASAKEIKPGVIEIRDRLGLQASGRMHMTDVSLLLNEPSSVAHWLELNAARLPCKLIVVDSFFSAATGSLAQDNVMQGAMDGVRALLRHADAVVIAHHDNKGGDIFGSVFLTAMTAAKVSVVRSVLKDGRPGHSVKVTVERLKWDPPTLKLAYTLDGPFLARAESSGAAKEEDAPIRRPDILALLPTTATPRGAARQLVEHLLGSGSPNSRAENWRRYLKIWQDAGRIAVDDKTDTIRRVA